MADGAKNVGQVAGIWISNVAPENTNIIWFDTNTSERRHKVYDFGQMKWVTLNPQIVVPTTYNELVNTARQSGLSVGSMYKLTDMSNVLAYAVTTTKVQYNDNKGNIIVDDLGTGKEYHVSSSNLLIDGVRGVFDTATNQLIFSFDEDSFDEDTYVFGKKKINNVWKLVKSKISALISSNEDNSITWKNGLFFSFNAAINAILNKRGGVVGKTAYDKDMEEIAQDIENVGKENQRILSTAKKYTDDKTTDDEIFGKKITDDIADGQPIDVHKNMTLKDIVANFQRWLTRLRWATGVKLTRSFTNARTFQWVNNNDTVESAFGKVQYILQNFTDTLTMPGDFVQNDDVTDEQYIKDEKFRNQTLRNTFAMIIGFIYNIANHSRMKELDMTTERATDEKELRRELNYLERNTAEDGPNSIITYSRKIYYTANTTSGIDELGDAMGLPTNIKVKYRNNIVSYDQWLDGSYIRFGVSGPIIALVNTGTITNETPGVYVKSVSPNEDGISVDVEWGYNAAYDGEGHEIPVTVPGSDVCSIYVKFNYLDIPREQLLQIPIKRLFPGQDMDSEDVGINITIGKAMELIINFIEDLSTNAHIGDDIRAAINNHSESNEDKIIEDLKTVSQYGINVSFGKALELIINYIAHGQHNIHIWLQNLNSKRVLDEGGLIQEAECEREDLADSLAEFMQNIIEFLLNAANNIHLNDDFEIAENIDDQTAATPADGDSINNALAKLGGWFNDLTKHIVFDTWEYSKVTFDYSEQEIVDLKDKSLYAVMQLIASYLEDTWANAHMNKNSLPLPTVTDEDDLIDQIDHKTGADNMGVNIYEAMGIIVAFIKNSMDTHHLPDDFTIDTWEEIKDFSLTSSESWQGQSLGYVLKKLIGIVSFGSKLIDISLSEDWAAESGEDLTQESVGQMQSFKMDAAFARLAGIILAWYEKLLLPEDFAPSPSTEISDESFTGNEGNKSIGTVLANILGYIARNTTNAHLPGTWTPQSYAGNVDLPQSNENIDTVVAKIVGKFNQIGDISNGFIQSKATTGNGVTRKTVFDLASAYLEFHSNNVDYLQLSGSRMEFKDGSYDNDAEFRADRLWMDMTRPYYKSYYWGSAIGGTRVSAPIAAYTAAYNGQSVATIMGVNLAEPEWNYGGAFSSLLIGGHTFDAIQVGPGGVVTLNKYQSCVITFGSDSNDINIYLPANPVKGRMVYIVQSGKAKIIIHAQGNTQIDRRGSSSQEIEKNARGYMFTFIFTETTYESPSVDGLWIVTSNDAE